MKNESIASRIFDVFNVVFFALLSITFLYPILYIIAISFSEPRAIIEGRVYALPVGFTTSAYKFIFRNSATTNAIEFTALLTVLGVVFSLVVTAMAAYPLSRRGLKGGKAIMKIIVFTMYFSGGLIPTYMTVRGLGLFNSIWSLILPRLVDTFLLIIMVSFMRELPYELEEAAKVEGCSNIKTFLYVFLPLCVPVLATLTIFYAVSYWNTFQPALLYIQSNSRTTLQVRLRTVLSAFSDSMDQSALGTDISGLVVPENVKGATVVVAVLPILVVYPLLQKYFIKGVAIGAIKG
ncbi:MAG: carbohydrate ABC transporter permease [Christensenellales bacterium]|jgi:putative aldouronate transport system permease protein